jgi:hypothetical protein
MEGSRRARRFTEFVQTAVSVPTLIGILGTLLLHDIAIQSLPFGRAYTLKPPERLV